MRDSVRGGREDDQGVHREPEVGRGRRGFQNHRAHRALSRRRAGSTSGASAAPPLPHSSATRCVHRTLVIGGTSAVAPLWAGLIASPTSSSAPRSASSSLPSTQPRLPPPSTTSLRAITTHFRPAPDGTPARGSAPPSPASLFLCSRRQVQSRHRPLHQANQSRSTRSRSKRRRWLERQPSSLRGTIGRVESTALRPPALADGQRRLVSGWIFLGGGLHFSIARRRFANRAPARSRKVSGRLVLPL